MIYTAINTHVSGMAAALGVVSKNYGVIRPIFEAGKRVPIACNTDNCQPGKYIYAVPNSNEAGICYTYVIRTTVREYNRDTWQYIVNARIVIWYNAGRAGFQVCDIPAFSVIQKAADCIGNFREVTLQPGVTGEVRAAIEQIITNPDEVFTPFSFADNAGLFAWPYDCFALVATFTVMVPKGCITYTPAEPVNCVDI